MAGESGIGVFGLAWMFGRLTAYIMCERPADKPLRAGWAGRRPAAPGAGLEYDLQACIDGDERAWDAFVERTAPVIYAAVARVIGPRRARREAADVVQDVYLRLLRDERRLLRSFDPARASMATWLTVVARSVAISHLRRRRGPEAVRLDDAPPVAAPDERHAGSPVADLPVPPDLLTGRQRLVLHLLFDRQMDVEEAAGLLGVEGQTVRSTKHKALQRLRGFMGGRRP
jgi:RNA polymerase sigma factor (sigma-70 family)